VLRIRVVLVLVTFISALSGFFRSSSLASQDILRVDVNLVNVFVTVQDERGQFIMNLGRDDFRLYEDDVLQDIRIFEKEDEVQSAVGILMDNSGSMVDILPLMVRGIHEFARSMPRLDDLFVATFGTSVKLIQDYSQSRENLDEAMRRLRPFGTSVMYDSLLYGMDKLSASDHERKALIVFTDGNDNGSVMTHGRIVEEAQRTAILLYFVAIGSSLLVDAHTLDNLAGVSGGRAFYIPKRDSAAAVLEGVRAELARQYYLGYYVPRKSGFHRIRVEIPGSNFKINTRTGYSGG
jgi:Ca-activated chloride channel family protein